MFAMSVAQTSEMDGKPASASLLGQCRKRLGDTVPQAGLLIAGHDLELDDFLCELYQAYPDLLLIGCTTIAPMSSAADYHEGANTLSLFASDRARGHTLSTTLAVLQLCKKCGHSPAGP